MLYIFPLKANIPRLALRSTTSQSTFFPYVERPSFVNIQNKNHDYIQVFFCKFNTRVGTLIVATIYLQLIQNRYMFRSITVLQCSHQHCVQPVSNDVKVVGYL